MFRPVFAQCLRSATRAAVVPRIALPTRLASPSSYAPIVLRFQLPRFYSAAAGLNQEEVEGRIKDLLQNFDKVKDASKVSGTSHFANDLGLDSLDTVEVVMAIEEEFSIEIPDKEADAIHSIDQAVKYILSQPDAQ